MAATGDRVPCVYVENHQVAGPRPGRPASRSATTSPFPGEPTGVERSASSSRSTGSRGHDNTIVNGIGRIGFMKRRQGRAAGRTRTWPTPSPARPWSSSSGTASGRSSCTSPRTTFTCRACRTRGSWAARRWARAATRSCSSTGAWASCWPRSTGSSWPPTRWSSSPATTARWSTTATRTARWRSWASTSRPARCAAASTAIFEGGTRMPFLVRWPGHVKPGVSRAVVSQVDFCASFAALAGQPLGPDDAPDSFNVLPALLGQSPTGRDHVLEYSGRVAIRCGFVEVHSRRRGQGREAGPGGQPRPAGRRLVRSGPRPGRSQ